MYVQGIYIPIWILIIFVVVVLGVILHHIDIGRLYCNSRSIEPFAKKVEDRIEALERKLDIIEEQIYTLRNKKK